MPKIPKPRWLRLRLLVSAKSDYYQALGFYYTLNKQIGNEDYINILTSGFILSEKS